jgi:hypothetical protein
MLSYKSAGNYCRQYVTIYSPSGLGYNSGSERNMANMKKGSLTPAPQWHWYLHNSNPVPSVAHSFRFSKQCPLPRGQQCRFDLLKISAQNFRLNVVSFNWCRMVYFPVLPHAAIHRWPRVRVPVQSRDANAFATASCREYAPCIRPRGCSPIPSPSIPLVPHLLKDQSL